MKEGLTVTELRAYAREIGMSTATKLTKREELIRAIAAWQRKH